MPEAPLILFDGLCPLCHGALRFVLKRDRSGVFRYAPLQGHSASKALARAKHRGRLPNSVILVEGRRLRFRSAAILGILARLGPPWPLLSRAASLLPAAWLDFLYDALAARRRRMFGAFRACPRPKPEWKGRFLR